MNRKLKKKKNQIITKLSCELQTNSDLPLIWELNYEKTQSLNPWGLRLKPGPCWHVREWLEEGGGSSGAYTFGSKEGGGGKQTSSKCQSMRTFHWKQFDMFKVGPIWGYWKLAVSHAARWSRHILQIFLHFWILRFTLTPYHPHLWFSAQPHLLNNDCSLYKVTNQVITGVNLTPN